MADTYWAIALASDSAGLRSRITACASKESVPDPDSWAYNTRWTWAAAPGWGEAYQYALDTHPPVEGEPPYDPGQDSAVITDAMILTQVQAMLADQPGPG